MEGSKIGLKKDIYTAETPGGSVSRIFCADLCLFYDTAGDS